MASTTVTLAQLKASGAYNLNPLAMAVARMFITTDKFTSQLPAMAVDGISNIYRRQSTRPLAKLHNVGQALSPTKAVNTTKTDEVGRILSVPSLDAKVARGHNLVDAWTEQLMACRWEVADKWANQVVNGTGATDGNIKGLLGLANEGGATYKYIASTSSGGTGLKPIHLDRLTSLVKYPVSAFVMPNKLLVDLKAQMLALGGVDIPQVERTFARFDGGNLETYVDKVPSYNGIPIYTNDWITTETTYSGPSKLRVYAVSFDEGAGLQYFYPTGTALGFEVEGPFQSESYDEKYMIIRHLAGLSLKATPAIAQIVNLRATY